MTMLGKHARLIRAHRAQGEVARAAGLQQALVSQIETGKVLNPKLDTLRALARGLGITLAELVDPENAKAPAVGRRGRATTEEQAR